MLVLGSAVFVVLGLWMIGAFGAQPETARYPASVASAIGWASILFFGLCGLVGLRRLFDTGEEMRIGPTGIRWVRWSDQTIPWSQIERVSEWSFRGQRSIILHLREPAMFPGKGISGMLAKANRGLTGGDVALTTSATDRSHDEAMAAIAHFASK
ncbi:hypothetical protein OLX23_04990 [Novosphingobium sp. JCM 18896]|nr:hypothetical protein [Novosphingobium sp. JCM 18896]